MNLDMRAVLLGQAVRAYLAGRGAQKTLVGYKYGTIETVLPAIPEVPEGYEGVRVVIHGKSTFGESISVHYFKSAHVEGTVLVLVGPGARYGLKSDGSWGSYSTTEDGFIFRADGSMSATAVTVLSIWTDTDIYYDDGSLYVAASEPVPVYE